jgi:putative spermidine/putrescine transport system ATP-binding protein
MASGRVSVDHIELGYQGETVLTLEHLDVKAGTFLSILGPSGCGKTTLLNALAGFVTPSTGQIRLDDRDITHLPPHRREMGLVFQNYALFPHMTVEKNLQYGLTVRKVPRAERESRVDEALQLVGLGDFRDRYPRQLSGGQQQRVAIARALVTRPKVLLLDEPLSNLDAKLRRQMRHELRELQREVGTTMIFVTHDQSEALAMSDRVVLLAGGHLEQEGTPEELYRAPRTPFAADFIGAANVIDARVLDAGTVSVAGAPLALVTERSAGDIVPIALRPETIELVVDPSFAGPKGEILSVVFGGDRYEYRLRLDDGTLVSATPSDRDSVGSVVPLGAGTRAGLSWSTDSAILLDGR